MKKIEQIRKIADNYGEEVAHIVLAWYFSQPSVDVIIPGAKRPEQVRSNQRAAEISLSEDDIQKNQQYLCIINEIQNPLIVLIKKQ